MAGREGIEVLMDTFLSFFSLWPNILLSEERTSITAHLGYEKRETCAVVYTRPGWPWTFPHRFPRVTYSLDRQRPGTPKTDVTTWCFSCNSGPRCSFCRDSLLQVSSSFSVVLAWDRDKVRESSMTWRSPNPGCGGPKEKSEVMQKNTKGVLRVY